MASNGIREVVPTYVGYPKDNISEELLGNQPMFGDAALKHRLSVEIIRPLAHGVIQTDGKGGNNKYLTAAKQLTRHLLEKGRPKEFDITDELRTACKSIVPGMVDSIAELTATYDPEFQEVIRSNVILAGGGSQMIGLPNLIEEAMAELGGGKVTRVDEPLFAGSNGALKMAQRMPKHFWKMLI